MDGGRGMEGREVMMLPRHAGKSAKRVVTSDVPAIHVLSFLELLKAWMPGTSPGMTEFVVGDLVRVGTGVDVGMCHRCCFFPSPPLGEGDWDAKHRRRERGFSKGLSPASISRRLISLSPPTRGVIANHSLSTIVTLAMPPPSHMVCNP